MFKKIVMAVITSALLFVGLTASADVLGVITANSIDVYEDVDNYYENVIGTLKSGDNVAILDTFGDWCRIGYGEKTAYVDIKCISSDEDVIDTYINELILRPQIIEYAKDYLGIPYVYGGTSPSGFDCSGFVQYVYAHFNISLPRVTYSQINCGEFVVNDDLEMGDLLFFRGGSHVGIYAGEGMYIHAPSTGRTISLDPLTRNVYKAKRLF